MSKYQEALDEVKNTTYDEPYDLDGWTEYNTKIVFDDDDNNIKLLQELIDKHEKLREYLKEQSVHQGNQHSEFENGLAFGYECAMINILDYLDKENEDA